jgi:D-lactate dehydrogenase
MTVRMAVFSARSYDRDFFLRANEEFRHDLVFLEAHLRRETARLAEGFPAVCVFVNDRLDAPVLETLQEGGTRLIALRSAGFNHVDVPEAVRRGLRVVRVPAYSPHAVAEHTIALLLAVNRKIHRAYQRVREGNFALDGLLGFDLHGRTVGIVGTGRIGTEVCRILAGFGCRCLAHDPVPNPTCAALGVRYVPLGELLAEAEIVTLHCPLTPRTHHLIDRQALERMRPGVVLVNTSRGAVIDTRAVIEALKRGRIGALAIDVYEEEGDLFFEDLSSRVIQDDVFARLLTFPNVLVTAHQAFFTREALDNIARTTLANVADFEAGRPLANEVTLEHWAR